MLNFHAKFFSDILSNGIEIDAYRDFLQPLGSEPLALPEFLVPQPLKAHHVLTEMYNLFRGRTSLVVALHNSEFFHLGTVNELLDLYLNRNSALAKSFRQTIGFTHLKNAGVTSSSAFQDSCIINSRLGENTSIQDGSLLEYCFVSPNTQLTVGRNCFISNCLINSDSALNIPDNVCLHTIPAIIEDKLQYFTIFFDCRDDLKKVYTDLSQVRLLNKQIPMKVVDLLRTNGTHSISIWSLKIFQGYASMNESFNKSLVFVQQYLDEKFDDCVSNDQSRYSLFDLLKNRSFHAMISFRKSNGLF